MALELVWTAAAPAPLDLLAESNHRIADHLSMLAGLLRLEISGIGQRRENLSPADVRIILENFGTRLETVGEVHRLLTRGQSGAVIDIDAYLETIAEGIVSALSGGETRLFTRLDSESLIPAEKAVLIGLLVGELVTNSMKYAHPSGIGGTISVQAQTSDHGMVEIIVADDGVGLPVGLDAMSSNSPGFRMVKSLAAQASASLTFENHGLGLTVIVRFRAA